MTVGALVLVIVYLSLGLTRGSGAIVASLVEILPIPLDDNLAITLFAGYTLKLLS